MPRRACFTFLTALGVLSLAATKALGAEWGPNLIGQSNQELLDLSGNRAAEYLSWYKLLLVAIVFLIWVRTTDWINRDCMKIGDRTEMPPAIWNPITCGSFLVGFLVVLFVPIFWVGFPFYVICALTPFIVYFFMRRSKLIADPEIVRQLKTKPGEAPPPPLLPQDEGAAVEFVAAGGDSKAKQVNLIRARQSIGFTSLKETISNALSKRAEMVMLDYTRNQVNCRLQVDGAWHPLPPMDRENGDAVLFSLKSLAGLKPADRRSKQLGKFQLKTETEKAGVEVLTQGSANGERVQIKFTRKRKTNLTLGQLGMFPDMVARIKNSLNKPGLAIITAPPAEGLTASWQGALTTTDRLTRDCVAILDEDETDTTVENIAIRRYNVKAGKLPIDVTRATLLSQPDFVAMPSVEDAEMMDLLAQQVLAHERSVLLRISATSAAAGLLAMYEQAGDRDQFSNAVKHVTGQRLVRRLCDQCKQEARVPPKTILQLGGNPKEQSTLFNQYRLPPPEQRVDEKGKPIEFPPCPVCAGIGYIGRIAVFEMIEMDDQVRTALRGKAKVDAIELAAQKAGKLPLVKQAYRLVLLGVTSLAEVQRVFK